MAVAGQWSVGGYNLPDLGISEKPIVQALWPSAQGVNNPLVLAQNQGTTSGLVGSGGQAVATPNTSSNPSNTVNISPNMPGLTSGQVQGAATTNPTPSPAPSGSGSSGSYQQQWESLGRTGQAPVGWHGEAQTQGIDESAINDVFNPTMNYLNQAEGAVRQDFPNVLDAAQKSYESAIAELSAGKQKVGDTIKEAGNTAYNTKESALASARRLYDELRRGYSQRFGGATSAGQAASELSSVEQQRQMGATNRDYASTQRQLADQTKQLETDYQTGTMKILESKTQAIAQANRDFQNKLLEISSQRAQTESAKAQAKLSALQDLRNKAYAAQQQALTYQQNLDMFYKQQQADLQTYAAKLAMSGQGAQAAQQNFQPELNPTSNLGVSTTGSPVASTYTGRVKKDIYP